MFWLSNARIDAFKGGVIAANPHATGLFHWHGVAYVFTDATFTFVNGKATEVGGTLLPLVYVCIFGAGDSRRTALACAPGIAPPVRD